MLNDEDLDHLANAHLGSDLQGIYWEAAAEIKDLRDRVENLRGIALSHAHAIVDCVHEGDLKAICTLETYAKKNKLDLT